MAHDHAHHHGDANSYYIEQLFTIAVCGAIGGVMMMMYFSGRVRFLFGNNEDQYMRVLLGGTGLVAVVLIRAVYVWFAVGAKAPAAHDHDHSECGHNHDECGHDHHHHLHHEHEEGIKAVASAARTSAPVAPALATAPAHSHDHDHDHHHHHDHDHDHDHHHDHGHDHDHGHGHDHDHDHGWAPWRFMLLLLPVILFFLGLPNQGIVKGSDLALDENEKNALEQQVAGDKGKKTAVVPMSFLQLEQAAMNRDVRDVQAGKTISITGMYFGNDPAHFTLQRFKINCCAADAIPLKAVIMVNPTAQKKYKLEPEQYQSKWVNITGRLQFFPLRGEYVPAIILDPDEQTALSEFIKVVPPDPNPYAS